ncbi:hypothetical protein F7232_04460 [Corynebacterium sp. 319]|uniref:alpha/beta hydrolase-fold protein n=1 Tax=unclassified Corynebacterium TaxID=2624378 RepID=UPI00125CB163|nr:MULTISPECIES: alpha/beta hydrolase-fold protein [unclassified Corynebacterium]KAB1554220.1 hypothetical protein F7232_04460 [Corynebacterium sp. 319]KAB3540036.1 hypothetical protein F8390_01870 [Corynebacterium sp. 366]
MRFSATSTRPNRRTSPARRVRAASLAVPVALALAMQTGSYAVAQPSSSGSLSSNLGPGSTAEYMRSDQRPDRTPTKVTEQVLKGLPEGVSVDRVEWITNRWANVYINSAAMPGEPIKVQILLARDWYVHPEKSFPSVWALDGLRARDDESGWTLETNIASFYADKNVNVILPVGGNSSFYADWQKPDSGKHFKWETFLTKELPPVLREGWRTTEDRAITGLSMGGTAAMNLAERFPDMFKFVGSFSGYLDTTSYGMPQGISYAVKEGSGMDATNMWGPHGSQDWIDHDPKLGMDALKGKTVYVSAGNGAAGQYDEAGDIPGLPKNLAGFGLEAMSRMTTETFVQRAKQANLPVIAKFRPSGTHSWKYWQFEMVEAWPYIADALGLPKDDRGAQCAAQGAIGARVADVPEMGECVSGEYDGAKGGKIQDFRGGRAFWTPKTDAHFLWGRIGARYSEIGATESWLGYPTSEEYTISNGRGRFVTFEHGNIYWTHQTGAVEIAKDFLDFWGTTKYENGRLGYPIAPAEPVAGGTIQKFENGVITKDRDGNFHYVEGKIAEKYMKLGGPTSDLGWPKSNEILINGGAFSQFEKGNIYWTHKTGAQKIMYGPIFDKWGEHRWEQGEYGWPTADFAAIPAGGNEQKFQNGTIREINGRIEEQRN